MDRMWLLWCGGFLLGCTFMAIIDAFILWKRSISHATEMEWQRCERMRSQEEAGKLERENNALKRKINEVHKSLCDR